MHVKIDDGDPLKTMFSARIHCRDCRIGKDAEPHRSLGFCMVSAWSYLAEGIADAGILVDHLINGPETRTDRT